MITSNDEEEEDLDDEYGIYTTLEELERNNKAVGAPDFLQNHQMFCVIQ